MSSAAAMDKNKFLGNCSHNTILHVDIKSLSINNLPKSIIDFLEPFKVSKGESMTHNVWMENHRGSYYIPPDALDNFHRVYKFNLENGLPLGIVERPKDIMPLLVDLDFRQDVSKRLYNFDQICQFIKRYDSVVKSLLQVDNPIYYVLEKPTTRKHKTGYKDGVHILCPSVVTRPQVQLLIRKMMLDNWDGMFEGCHFTNTKEDIYDETVLGTNGWFMYGSKKPDEEHPWTLSKTVMCEDDDVLEVEGTSSKSDLVDLLLRYRRSTDLRMLR